MTAPNFDTMLNRLHERQTERVDDAAWETCDYCGAGLTTTDILAKRCTQCETELYPQDESADEHLEDDGYGDY